MAGYGVRYADSGPKIGIDRLFLASIFLTQRKKAAQLGRLSCYRLKQLLSGFLTATGHAESYQAKAQQCQGARLRYFYLLCGDTELTGEGI